jgi:pyruvate formate lyase activating enzyme
VCTAMEESRDADNTEAAARNRTELPLILEIKGNSLDDGPGIRTVIFFKGCPLSCSWCHNPECKSIAQEISFDPELCIDCESCLETCKRGALEPNNPYYINRDICNLCFDCVETCPSGALARVGRYMKVDEVVAAIEKDQPFFRTSGGGVTLSGGEPLLFIDYVSGLLKKLKKMGVHTLIETCGYFNFKEFNIKILPWVKTIYFDLKLFDATEHKEHCGVDNALILENFEKLSRARARSGIELLARIPLIPGITATNENLSKLAAFLEENGAKEIALLEYNPLWLEKSRKIGRENVLAFRGSVTTWMKAAEMQRCRSIFQGFEIK